MLNNQEKQEAHEPLTYVPVVIMALPFVGLIAVLATMIYATMKYGWS
jgi:hypothetical protein